MDAMTAVRTINHEMVELRKVTVLLEGYRGRNPVKFLNSQISELTNRKANLLRNRNGNREPTGY